MDAMNIDTAGEPDVDGASTVRMDRRQTALARIEAALLADKLSVLEISEEAAGRGADPYNCGRVSKGVWGKARR